VKIYMHIFSIFNIYFSDKRSICIWGDQKFISAGGARCGQKVTPCKLAGLELVCFSSQTQSGLSI
jgi:hypothetical protein